MSTFTTPSNPARTVKQRRIDPIKAGLPDPRAVTDYTVTLGTVAGKSRLTVTLSQPCVIKNPLWPLVDCTAGALIYPASCTVLSNTTFYMDFAGVVATSAAFVQVPYQDTQVQNFAGGFVRSGGQWFREPIIN